MSDEEQSGLDKITLYGILGSVVLLAILFGGGLIVGVAWMFWIALIATPLMFLVLLFIMLVPDA